VADFKDIYKTTYGGFANINRRNKKNVQKESDFRRRGQDDDPARPGGG